MVSIIRAALLAQPINAKGQEVNGFLSSKCSELCLGFIDNHHISTNHLNGSGLHGTIALAQNLLRSINL